MENLLKLLEENPELGHEVEVMWARGESAQKIVDMLSDKDIAVGTAQVEELLASMQARRAAAISEGQKVDREQLKAVAGGECGSQMANSYHIPDDEHLGNCSIGFYTRECSATVEADSWCWSNDACALFSEQYFCATNYD